SGNLPGIRSPDQYLSFPLLSNRPLPHPPTALLRFSTTVFPPPSLLVTTKPFPKPIIGRNRGWIFLPPRKGWKDCAGFRRESIPNTGLGPKYPVPARPFPLAGPGKGSGADLPAG